MDTPIKTEQRAIIVSDTSICCLNSSLGVGWKVVHSCPMPSSCCTYSAGDNHNNKPTCLIIIEKEIRE